MTSVTSILHRLLFSSVIRIPHDCFSVVNMCMHTHMHAHKLSIWLCSSLYTTVFFMLLTLGRNNIVISLSSNTLLKINLTLQGEALYQKRPSRLYTIEIPYLMNMRYFPFLK